ncbi:transcriptional regulator [Sphingomonadales bacterium EhC05]|nr:transcriptional regulator [Sphingomonadales bacterium EhC05]
MTQPMKRGKLAQLAGCNPETIRYYEKIRLLHEPDRTESGHRVYSRDDQRRLKFILRSRELGFSIEGLRGLLKLVDADDYTCGEVLDVTTRHIADIKSKISDLKKLERTLLDMSSQCAGGQVPHCPIINIMSE